MSKNRKRPQLCTDCKRKFQVAWCTLCHDCLRKQQLKPYRRLIVEHQTAYEVDNFYVFLSETDRDAMRAEGWELIESDPTIDYTRWWRPIEVGAAR